MTIYCAVVTTTNFDGKGTSPALGNESRDTFSLVNSKSVSWLQHKAFWLFWAGAVLPVIFLQAYCARSKLRHLWEMLEALLLIHLLNLIYRFSLRSNLLLNFFCSRDWTLHRFFWIANVISLLLKRKCIDCIDDNHCLVSTLHIVYSFLLASTIRLINSHLSNLSSLISTILLI